MNVCRFCKADSYHKDLVKYGLRHRGCVECVVARFTPERLAGLDGEVAADSRELEALGKVADLQARLLGMAQAVIDAKRLAL